MVDHTPETVNGRDGAATPPVEPLPRSFTMGYMALSSWLMAAAFLATVVLACIYAVKLYRNASGGKRAQAARTLLLGAPALFVPLYTIVMSTHAIVHIPVFSSRGWLIFFAICLVTVVRTLLIIDGKETRKAEGEQNPTTANRL